MTGFTKKDLWVPEMLFAAETDWGGNADMGVFFDEGCSLKRYDTI